MRTEGRQVLAGAWPACSGDSRNIARHTVPRGLTKAAGCTRSARAAPAGKGDLARSEELPPAGNSIGGVVVAC